MTVAIISACVLVFLYLLSADDGGRRLILALGTIPSVLFGTTPLPHEFRMIPAELTLLTSMFLHGGRMHLIFNMLFLDIRRQC